DQGFLLVQEMPSRTNATVLRIIEVERGPGDARGHGHRRCVHARIHPRDQVPLPGQALQLPDTERTEQQRPGQAERKQRQPLAPAPRHGIWPDAGACIIPGIMLRFRWYMIQIEPAMVITSSTAVNT